MVPILNTRRLHYRFQHQTFTFPIPNQTFTLPVTESCLWLQSNRIPSWNGVECPTNSNPANTNKHTTRRTRGDEPTKAPSPVYSTRLNPNQTQRVLVQISSKWLLYMLQMLLVGHHNFEISSSRGYFGSGTCPTEPKLFFPIFWNGQNHVHFELA